LKNIGSNKGHTTFCDATLNDQDLTTENTENSSLLWREIIKKNQLTSNMYVHKSNPASTTSITKSTHGSTFAESNYYHLPPLTETDIVTWLHSSSDEFLSHSSLSKLMLINTNVENLKWSPGNTPNSPIMSKQKSSNINTMGQDLNNEDISTGMIPIHSFT
jgi:hypothetical protein